MKTVLVVEDSRAEQTLIVSILEKMGHKVCLAETAESALDWLTQHQPPDLIVLDIVMPGANGLELCREVRAKPDFKDVPIIFCSSKDQDFDRFWALRQGGNAYITKPYNPDELMQTVTEHLQ
ncbi:response regulator [Candidatus Synechococcus calcipolaris G9]|uniref:Response regulator n=1 Tax=Candidatus Synechococcus calcipolaris G9 TaxID=1497997 RepID=A0ABT6EVL3_9SYNE|nr:response regulator [Candidatus Synechococcus calcipolaris]MDG2989820.1 response regulator [Candidatus Synechococcus calcipolaris G9]